MYRRTRIGQRVDGKTIGNIRRQFGVLARVPLLVKRLGHRSQAQRLEFSIVGFVSTSLLVIFQHQQQARSRKMRLERGVKFFLIALGASAALLASAAFGQGSLNAAGQATPTRPPAGPPQAQPVKWEKGAQPAMLLPKSEVNPTVLLWPQGAPGSEGKTEDETYRLVDDQMVISNVHRPSITVYLPPKDKATGAGIIVMPGGASRELWINKEGYRVAQWLSQRGIAAFVLKYRLPRADGSTYTTEDHSLPDIQRALRVVRSRATEWRVEPDRVGVMGFSAGGFLAGFAGARYGDPVKSPVDSIDQLSAKPAFMALIYGTPFAGPMQANAKITKDLPPTFLCAGSDDGIAASYPDVFKAIKQAGVPVELHMFAGVGHGFALQFNMTAVSHWPELFQTWLFERGFLTQK